MRSLYIFIIILLLLTPQGCIQDHFVPKAPEPTTWEVTVHFPDGDSGEYKFIVDGNWIKDPNNSDVANDNSHISVPSGGSDQTFTFTSDQIDPYKVVKEAYVSGSFNGWNNYENAFAKK